MKRCYLRPRSMDTTELFANFEHDGYLVIEEERTAG